MALAINVETIGDAWLASIERVLDDGDAHFDEDVAILELRQGLAITITNPSVVDPVIDCWGDRAVVARMLKKFSRNSKMADRPFTYGELIYDKNGVDQFAWIIDRIREKPETKSATVSLLSEGDSSKNLPCLVTLDAKLRGGGLDLHFFFRSQNIFGRQYANLTALADLQARMAEELACQVGVISGYVSSPHIYNYDIDNAKNVVSGVVFDNVDKFYSHGPESIRIGYG